MDKYNYSVSGLAAGYAAKNAVDTFGETQKYKNKMMKEELLRLKQERKTRERADKVREKEDLVKQKELDQRLRELEEKRKEAERERKRKEKELKDQEKEMKKQKKEMERKKKELEKAEKAAEKAKKKAEKEQEKKKGSSIKNKQSERPDVVIGLDENINDIPLDDSPDYIDAEYEEVPDFPGSKVGQLALAESSVVPDNENIEAYINFSRRCLYNERYTYYFSLSPYSQQMLNSFVTDGKILGTAALNSIKQGGGKVASWLKDNGGRAASWVKDNGGRTVDNIMRDVRQASSNFKDDAFLKNGIYNIHDAVDSIKDNAQNGESAIYNLVNAIKRGVIYVKDSQGKIQQVKKFSLPYLEKLVNAAKRGLVFLRDRNDNCHPISLCRIDHSRVIDMK